MSRFRGPLPQKTALYSTDNLHVKIMYTAVVRLIYSLDIFLSTHFHSSSSYGHCATSQSVIIVRVSEYFVVILVLCCPNIETSTSRHKSFSLFGKLTLIYLAYVWIHQSFDFIVTNLPSYTVYSLAFNATNSYLTFIDNFTLKNRNNKLYLLLIKV
jgi:hypothetical protein